MASFKKYCWQLVSDWLSILYNFALNITSEPRYPVSNEHTPEYNDYIHAFVITTNWSLNTLVWFTCWSLITSPHIIVWYMERTFVDGIRSLVTWLFQLFWTFVNDMILFGWNIDFFIMTNFLICYFWVILAFLQKMLKDHIFSNQHAFVMYSL